MEPRRRRGRRRRRRAQHLLHPGERRQQALRQPRPPQVVKDAPTGPPDRGGGCLAQKDRDLIRERAGHVDVVLRHPQRAPGRRAAAPGRARAARSPRSSRRPCSTTTPCSRRRCRPVARWPTPPGSRSRSAATTAARSASCPPCGAGRSADRSPRSSPRWSALAADGVTEVTLLGQNVNSYGRDIQLAARRDGDVRRPAPAVRRPARGRWAPSTASAGCATPAPHPKDLRPETSRPWPSTPRRVRAPAPARSSRAAIACWPPCTGATPPSATSSGWPRPGAAIPDLAVTTDIIVGFPGETDDDFERTLEVVAEAEYDSAYTFIFSPRARAPRRPTMTDRLRRPGEVVAERFDRLRVVVERSRARQARGAGRADRGGAGRGPEQAGPGRHLRAHPAEQARPLPGAGDARPARARSPGAR